MDTFSETSSALASFQLDQGLISKYSKQNLVNGVEVNHECVGLPFLPTLDYPCGSSMSLNSSSLGEACDTNDYNTPVLKYIHDILLEEDIEDKPCMLQDCLALQAAEKSFYDVLNREDPPLVNQTFDNSEDFRQSYHCSGNVNIAAKIDELGDPSETSQVQSLPVKYLSDTVLVTDLLSEVPGSLGSGEESKEFLPNEIIDLEGCQLMLQGSEPLIGSNSGPESESDGNNLTNKSEGKKNHQREDGQCLEEWRSNKQSVVYSADDSESQELFDKALLFQDVSHDSHSTSNYERSRQSKGSKPARSKRQQNENGKLIDLCAMLIQCAQAVANYDQRTASELLKKIRQHSSPYGDATQRLAHYFADALEARLAGSRAPSYSPLVSLQISTAELVKAYQVHLTSIPFKTIPCFLANRSIAKLAEKATRLHIIDFGTSYGFQWPSLIQCLSERPGGPPKLRITAIELPQPGFRPTDRIEETGRRLAKYSTRFGVPFEYHAIAQNWETIRFDDLNIDRKELIVVNCLHRLKHVPDVTVMGNSPRDTVLKLIKKINPELFIHGIVNGAYNSPFFFTRFKQAIFHFDARFDMFEATLPREGQQRLIFERAYGRDIMNVVACEGLEIVERPETYQNWQVRNVRAGFRQLPLDQELLEKVKSMSMSMGYHNDFSIDEDEQWMLQGWKGKIMMALSFWKP